MPKITKNSIYNLNSQFRSTITDDRYTQNDADNLLVWIKGDSTSALIDLFNLLTWTAQMLHLVSQIVMIYLSATELIILHFHFPHGLD